MQSAQFLDGFDQPLDESKTNEDKSTMKFVKEPGATWNNVFVSTKNQ